MSTFYNRNRTITGTAPAFTGVIPNNSPVFGSSVVFTANSNNYNVDDNFFNNIPLSPNHLNATFNLSYHLPDEASGIRNIIAEIEGATGNRLLFSRFSTGIFRPQYGYCESYNITHINPKHYQLDLKMEVLDVAPLMSWSGGAYVSGGWTGFAHGVNYEKFDIIYTGIDNNKLNNFYYCTGDHTSSGTNSPTGSVSMWTQKFFFEPDQGFTSNITPTIDTLEFLNSKKQRLRTKDNIAVFPINYTFSNRSDKEAKSILHFLENKAGYRRFRHDHPSLFDAPKVLICPTWEYRADYINAHTISTSFIEDPLGIYVSGIE